MVNWWTEACWVIGFIIAPRDYVRVVRPFEEFRDNMVNSRSGPYQVDQLLHYGVLLKETTLATLSIRGWFSALAFASKALGHKVKTSDFRVCKMLEGRDRKSPQG